MEDVVIKLVADTAQLQAELNKVKQQMGGIGTEAAKGGAAINGATQKAASSTEKLRGAMAKLGVTIGAAFIVRQVINFARESVKAYRASQAAEAKLLAALNGRKDVQDRLIQQAAKMQKTTVFADDQVVQAQAFLAAQGRTEEQIRKTIEAAAEFAAVTGDDLGGAVRKLDMTYEGSIGRLGLLDSSFKTLSETELKNGAAIDLVAQKYKGMAAAFAATDAGKVMQLNNAFDDLKESVGAGMSSALANASTRLKLWVNTLNEAVKPDAAQAIDQQKQKFILLADAATQEGLTKERRIELIEQMQAIEPGFLAGLDAEKVTTDELTQAYKNSLETFNAQIEAKKFAINVEKEYNDLADEQLKIDAEREEAAAKLAAADGEVTADMKEAILTVTEYGQEISNWLVPGGRFVDGLQEIQSENLQTVANIREGELKLKQIRLSTIESLKSLVADGWNPHNAAVQDAERIMKQLGADDGTIAKIVKQIGLLNGALQGAGGDDGTIKDYDQLTKAIKELEDRQKDLMVIGLDLTQVEKDRLAQLKRQRDLIDGTIKGTEKQTTAYQRLTEQIGKLQEKLTDQVLTGKGDIEQTKAQILQKTELKNRVDALTSSINSQIDAMLNLERMETKPQVAEIPVTPNFKLADAPEQTATASFFAKMGEDAGNAWWYGFIGFLASRDEQDMEIKKALGQVLDFAINQITDSLTSGNDELADALNQRVDLITKSVDDVSAELDREIELNKQGFASNVQLKRDELQKLKQEQDKAIADRDAQIEKQREQERTAATISATVGAIKLLANAVETGGIAGLITGLLAVGTFIAAISNINSQASGAVQFAQGTAQILGGQSHAGGGVNLGQMGEAEKGEFLGILSAKQTKRYGKPMMTLFDGLNQSNDAKIAAGLLGIAGLSAPEQPGQSNVELKEVKEIKGMYDIMRRPQKSVTHEGNKRIEKIGGHTRIVYVN